MALNYDELSATTYKHIMPVVIDNIFRSNSLLHRAKENWYETIDGGTKIVIPVAYAASDASGWYSGAETLNTSSNDQISGAEWDWKNIYSTITITREDELKNSGKSQIIDFVKAKVEIAEKTLSDNLGTALFNLGTDSKAIVGLRLAIDSAGSYAGIDRSSYSWWAAQEDSTTSALTLPALQSLQGDCSEGADRPTVAVTTQDIYDDYWSLVQPQQRFEDVDTAKAGFRNLMFNGIPIIEDSHCPSGHLFMINEKYIKLKAHKDENFRFEPFMKYQNQNVATAKIFWTGALCINNCRMHGKMNNLS